MMAMFSQNLVGPRTHALEESVPGYGLVYHPAEEIHVTYPAARFEGTALFPQEAVYDDRITDYRSVESGLVEDSGYRRTEATTRDRFQERDKEDRRSRNSDDDYRDRERERDRSRRWDRERDRGGRDSRYDHHDRERRGSRERRDRGDRERDGRTRSPTKSNNTQDLSDQERDNRESRDERGGEKWMTDTPTHTILLRGLPIEADEKDIRAELMMLGTPVKDVRLMRRKDTGTSRGFAFVEFQNIADSQRWMDQTQGRLRLLDKYTVNLYYSTPKSTGEKITDHKTDWSCSKCGAHNFKRRDFCFKCGVSREESERTKESDGFDQVGTNPCNTLIFRGLDALTTEDKLLAFIGQLGGTSDVKNIRIIRDPVTNVSRGYGFAEMASIQKSTLFLDQIKTKHPTLELDGKLLMVAFAKNTFNTVMATFGHQSGWNYGQAADGYQAYDYAAYDPTGQYYDYSAYYGQPQPAVPTNNAAAVAQAAIQQAQAAKQYKTGNFDNSTTTTSFPGDYPKYPPPDVSTYQYEETSGYYFDPSTGLYYDPGTQYYYNAQSGQFMYWDVEKSTYLSAPTSQQTDGDPNKETKKEKEKKEKVKVAKKIAKDMEKWAKSLNAHKDTLKDGFKKGPPSAISQNQGEKESATADAGFAILEKKQLPENTEDVMLMPPPPMPVTKQQPSPSTSALVDYGGGDSDSEEDDTSSGLPLSERMIDWGKMACLLCKRQFNSPEMLNKHTQLSDLHKQNLQSLMTNKSSTASHSTIDKNKDSYRDRAKERRQKYGTGIPPTNMNKKKPVSMFEDPVIAEQPTKAGLGQDNIGNKLLQKMGWSLGQGLGKAGQGITNPIQAQRRVVQAGLGARGSSVISAPGDTYKDAVKKTMFARYHEVE